MNKYDEMLNEYKSMFPEDIETIILTKEKYDEMLGKREYENIILRERIDKIKEYIKDNGIDEEMAECCDRYDINGIEIYKLLEEIE